MEQAEALLLQIYLHCPEQRPTITQTLEEKDLLFAFARHRLLWQKIIEVEAHFSLTPDPDNQLPSLLQLAYLEQEADFDAINPLFQLTEITREDLYRANLQISQAIAILEKINWEQYKHYCIEQLQNLDPQQQAKDFQYYQREWMYAVQQAKQLDQQRFH